LPCERTFEGLSGRTPEDISGQWGQLSGADSRVEVGPGSIADSLAQAPYVACRVPQCAGHILLLRLSIPDSQERYDPRQELRTGRTHPVARVRACPSGRRGRRRGWNGHVWTRYVPALTDGSHGLGDILFEVWPVCRKAQFGSPRTERHE